MFSARQGFYGSSTLGPFSPIVIVADVSRTDSGPANTFQIQFQPPLTSANIDWGDGNTQTVTVSTAVVTKTYATGGNKTIAIDGIFGARFGSGTANKVLAVTSWGNSEISNSAYMLSNAKALTSIPNTSPVFSSNASVSSMFRGADVFNGAGISNWNTSNITNMENMFHSCAVFNRNLNLWDTSNVTNMSGMFILANAFNGNISTWDTSNVSTMRNMFSNAASFNGNLSNWNTSNVTTTQSMFSYAPAFNGNIANWDMSKVTVTESMFSGATAFNQSIGNWNVGNVNLANYMFSGATSFDQNLSSWTTNLASQPTSFSGGANANFATNANLKKPFLRGGTIRIAT